MRPTSSATRRATEPVSVPPLKYRFGCEMTVQARPCQMNRSPGIRLGGGDFAEDHLVGGVAVEAEPVPQGPVEAGEFAGLLVALGEQGVDRVGHGVPFVCGG